jgi:thymidylate synthase (FAD)
MGTDLTTVNAARVSFDKESWWESVTDPHHGGKIPPYNRLSEKDEKLIHYLAKHKHMSPFGHCFASFVVKAPIFVARQLVKHEYLRINEVSRRYVDTEPEFYEPLVWRGAPKDKKQGSSGVEVVDLRMQGYGMQTVHDATFKHQMHSMDLYRDMIKADVAPEMARMVLPQNTMTEWWWSGSLDAFANMCILRLGHDAQYETQLVAREVSKFMSELFPVSWKALMENNE